MSGPGNQKPKAAVQGRRNSAKASLRMRPPAASPELASSPTMSATDSTTSTPLGGSTVLPSSNSSSGSYPCFGAGGSAGLADAGLALALTGEALAFLVENGVSASVVIGVFAGVGVTRGLAGEDAVFALACPTRAPGAALWVDCFVLLVRVVFSWPADAAVSRLPAFARAASLRGLLRCGLARGSAARTPPSRTGVSAGPSELLVSLGLTVSQSSRTRLDRAPCVIFRLPRARKR